jgi:hypothetical protein
MQRPVDVAIMCGVLWLLGSMVIDVLTPKELTVYIIAMATAPAVIVVGLCYYLQFPMIDFTMIFATFWLAATLAIEWLSPRPLHPSVIGAAVAPALIAGAVLHWRRYRSGESRRMPALNRSAQRPNPNSPGRADKEDQASVRADAT